MCYDGWEGDYRLAARQALNAREIHPSSHRDILAAVGRTFAVERLLRFPALLPADLRHYVACRHRRP